MTHYVLNADRSIEQLDDIVEWTRRFELDDRVVADTLLPTRTLITTVFTGIPLGLDRTGRPWLFESSVWKGPQNGRRVLYATFGDAQKGHRKLVQEVCAAEGVSPPDPQDRPPEAPEGPQQGS